MDDRGLLERWGALAASAAGGATLLGGVVYATQWAVRQGWLVAHPEVGLAVGLGVGVGGLVLAEPLWGRDQRAVAAGVSGSGLGIVFFTLYAAHAWYGLLGGPLAAIALTAAAFAGMFQAVRRHSELMAAIGSLGGMVTPLLLADGSGHAGPFLAHLLLMNAAVAVATLRREWRVLPWLAVGSTLLLGVAWAAGRQGTDGALITSLSGALLGAGWAVLAAHPRVPRSVGWPYWVGAAGGLVVTLPFIGIGDGFVVAIGIPLLAIAFQTAVLQVAAPRHGPDGLGLAVSGIGGFALVALALRWGATGHADPGTLVALVSVPLTAAWSARSWTGRGGVLDLRILGGFVLISVLATAFVGGLHDLEAVAVVVAAAAQALDLGRGARRQEDAGVAGAIGILAASGLLIWNGDPVGTLVAGSVVAVVALLPAVLLQPRPASAVGWLPTLVVPALLVPLGLAWRDAMGTGTAGVVPLVLAGVSFALLDVVRSPGWDATPSERQDAVTAHWGIVVLFTTIAVPMQLSAQWLTIGWACEGLALTAVAARTHSRWMAGVGLGLLAAVTVRLALNPAVLGYHHVARPHLLSWVLYGYGLPVGALWTAARLVDVPASWRPDRIRLALGLAAIAVGFVGINVFVSHAFAGGETLSLFDTSLTARLFRTLGWTVFGVALIGRRGPGWRVTIGAVLLAAGTFKLAAADFWLLESLPRAVELVGVAGCLFTAAALLQLRSRRSTDERLAT